MTAPESRPSLGDAAQWAEYVAHGGWPTASDATKYMPVIVDEINRCHTANAGLTTGLDRAVWRGVVLSNMLRRLARRHGVLRRAYNSNWIDPWEENEHCANANWASPCGPALRLSKLCAPCLEDEVRKGQALRDGLRRALGHDELPDDAGLIGDVEEWARTGRAFASASEVAAPVVDRG